MGLYKINTRIVEAAALVALLIGSSPGAAGAEPDKSPEHAKSDKQHEPAAQDEGHASHSKSDEHHTATEHGGSEAHHGPVKLEVGFVNRRLWRGFVENDTPAMQPSLGFHYKGFGVKSWSNLAHMSPHNQNWTEHELEFDYERHFGSKWKGIIGYIHYSFPDIAPAGKAAKSSAPKEPAHGLVLAAAAPAEGGKKEVFYPRYTQEVFVGVQHESWLHPSFRVYRDFDGRTGTYYYLSLGHPFALGRKAVVRPTTGLGVNQDLIIHNTAVSNFDLGVAVDLPMGRVTFSPFFTRMIGHRTLFGSHNLFGVGMSVQ